MRVLFLDFDGVLNSNRFIDAMGEKWRIDVLDPAAGAVLESIVRRAGAKVVISSTWRKHRTLAQLREYLAGIGFTGEVIDVTPALHGAKFSRSVDRGLEIQKWIDEHPGVEEFAIVDDDDDMAHLLPRLVRTDGQHGLLPEHADRLVALLTGAP